MNINTRTLCTHFACIINNIMRFHHAFWMMMHTAVLCDSTERHKLNGIEVLNNIRFVNVWNESKLETMFPYPGKILLSLYVEQFLCLNHIRSLYTSLRPNAYSPSRSWFWKQKTLCLNIWIQNVHYLYFIRHIVEDRNLFSDGKSCVHVIFPLIFFRVVAVPLMLSFNALHVVMFFSTFFFWFYSKVKWKNERKEEKNKRKISRKFKKKALPNCFFPKLVFDVAHNDVMWWIYTRKEKYE